jgi:flagellar biosynthesis anti-sigma factor FlgM
MPDISAIGHGSVGPTDRTSAPHNRLEPDPGHAVDPPRADPDRPGDRVELSEHARYLDSMRRLPSVRDDRVQQIRDAIAEGRYETEEKLDRAIDRLIEEMFLE